MCNVLAVLACLAGAGCGRRVLSSLERSRDGPVLPARAFDAIHASALAFVPSVPGGNPRMPAPIKVPAAPLLQARPAFRMSDGGGTDVNEVDTPRSLVMREKIQAAFEKIDVDSSRTLTYDELYPVMAIIWPSVEDAEVQRLFVSMDANGNGEIDLNEFVDWVYDGMINTSPEQIEGLLDAVLCASMGECDLPEDQDTSDQDVASVTKASDDIIDQVESYKEQLAAGDTDEANDVQLGAIDDKESGDAEPQSWSRKEGDSEPIDEEKVEGLLSQHDAALMGRDFQQAAKVRDELMAMRVDVDSEALSWSVNPAYFNRKEGDNAPINAKRVQELIVERTAARREGDLQKAGEIRAVFDDMGVIVWEPEKVWFVLGEKRTDPDDGEAYLLEEFRDFYGEDWQQKWDSAKPVEALVPSA